VSRLKAGTVKFKREKIMEEITSTELKQRLDNGDDIQIVDVREDNEVAIGRIPNSIHIPLGQVLNRMNEIDPNRETVVHCKMGGRSARAIDALQRSGFQGKLINLKGGIIGWSNEVDPSVPKY
jgi:adenylyltransferase/sulfurtransferase